VGDVAESGQPGRPGRPRDPSLEPRVVAAALAVYAESGWSGFNFEAVARRAGVGKAPLYLRWSSKEDLLLAAFNAHTQAITIRDTGNLRDDLIAYSCRLLDSEARPDGLAWLRLHLEAGVIPALHATFSSQISSPHVEGARALLNGALKRGDLPAGSPADLLLDSLYGAVLIKVLLSPPGERARLSAHPLGYAEPIVDFVLCAMAGASRRHRQARDPGSVPIADA